MNSEIFLTKLAIILLLCVITVILLVNNLQGNFWDEYKGYRVDKLYRDFPNLKYKPVAVRRSIYVIEYGPYTVYICKDTRKITNIYGTKYPELIVRHDLNVFGL